jgi:hypothetical protein
LLFLYDAKTKISYRTSGKVGKKSECRKVFFPFALPQKRKFHLSVKICKNKANARKFCLENFVDVIFLERTDYPG